MRTGQPPQGKLYFKASCGILFPINTGNRIMASKRKRQTLAANREWLKQDAANRYAYQLLRESSDEEVTPIKPHYKGKGKDHRNMRRGKPHGGKLDIVQAIACIGQEDVKHPKPVRRPAREIRKLYYPTYGVAFTSDKPSDPSGWIYSKSLRGWVRSTLTKVDNHDD